MYRRLKPFPRFQGGWIQSMFEWWERRNKGHLADTTPWSWVWSSPLARTLRFSLVRPRVTLVAPEINETNQGAPHVGLVV
ncbi:hypothetical protein BDM02DRAFT_3018426 [Thelephora ganbajun]|uniref:Uncharacterized protein n=1 Tax=Thelephora ganbajun TaxID=370292 RepID=A0ACB6ZAF4_THEGA|nr:hypothetical protein BDM02DRAFT_3018426 [Thelephora ganbajun]